MDLDVNIVKMSKYNHDVIISNFAENIVLDWPKAHIAISPFNCILSPTMLYVILIETYRPHRASLTT
jgi:hypothetical protein